ncbi:MAG: single-stranded-DNA-specific exonuclease RecJ [Alphaproteobacteria bacterium]|nr:single-stranded-DNA-specific exonuclease RecJ [Alphaproteobacteria bacterium]
MSLTHHYGPIFLQVERSILGRRWRARLDSSGESQSLALTQAYGLDDLLARILVGRGVLLSDLETYLNPSLRALLPNPATLQDMTQAVARLARALTSGEQVAVFGDYDVDGACSAALLIDYFRAAGGLEPLLHIPDRIFEGYGPNVEAIQQLAAQGAKLLITVDCGTTSHEALAAARSLGMDVIVLDHHQAPLDLPNAMIVNPNRQDDLSGQGILCAAGVVFLTLVALNRALQELGWWDEERRAPDLLAALDLVALATVADVAPLTGLNRAFVVQGLKVLGNRHRLGLAALLAVSRLDGPLKAQHLGFALGPRINAGGRIGDASLGCRLLTISNSSEAERLAAQLDRLNVERREIEQRSVDEALALAEHRFIKTNRLSCLIVESDDWHPGVVGLIASRLKDRFNIPSFAFASKGSKLTGSGRSLSGVDIGRAVRNCVEAGVAEKGGGHAMAAGVTLDREQLGAFRDYLNDHLADAVDRSREEDALIIDGALTGRAVNIALLEKLSRAGPFGQGNPEPLFVLPNQQVVSVTVVGDRHLRARLRSGDGATLDAMAFRAAEAPLGQALLKGIGGHFHIAARISSNHYQGRERPQTAIIDMAQVQT